LYPHKYVHRKADKPDKPDIRGKVTGQGTGVQRDREAERDRVLVRNHIHFRYLWVMGRGTGVQRDREVERDRVPG
jgi:hypothetical protein